MILLEMMLEVVIGVVMEVDKVADKSRRGKAHFRVGLPNPCALKSLGIYLVSICLIATLKELKELMNQSCRHRAVSNSA